jgi:quercetin dioxygenase-like cupin family protein
MAQLRPFKAGDTFFEAPGVVHSMIENPTAEPAEILAVFVADDGAELTTPIK